MDSNDKLKLFGICINGSIDGYSRKIIWLNADKTSSDQSVIGAYFSESVDHFKSCPHIVRADTENSTCTLQRFLREEDTDAYSGDKSFTVQKKHVQSANRELVGNSAERVC